MCGSVSKAHNEPASRLKGKLDAVGAQIKQVAAMGLPWMQVSDWSKRSDWNDKEWVAFMITFKAYGGQVFMGDDTPAEEKVLFDSFLIYWTYYARLPDLPEGVPESATMEAAGDRVDVLLTTFQSRLGDPMAPCNVCGEFALGRKLLRCSRCKRACYCLLSGVSKSGLAAAGGTKSNALNDGVAVIHQEEEAQKDYDDLIDSYGGLAMAVQV